MFDKSRCIQVQDRKVLLPSRVSDTKHLCLFDVFCQMILLVSVILPGIFRRVEGIRQDWSGPWWMPSHHLGSALPGPISLQFLRFYILVWMLCSNSLCLPGIWLHGTVLGVNLNANDTSGLCSISQGFHLLVVSFTSNQSQQVFWMCAAGHQSAFVDSYCTYKSAQRGAGTAFKGGFSVLKASVATSESLYFLLSGYFVHYRSMPDTQSQWFSVSRETYLSSITDYRIRRHFQQSFDPVSSPQFVA